LRSSASRATQRNSEKSRRRMRTGRRRATKQIGEKLNASSTKETSTDPNRRANSTRQTRKTTAQSGTTRMSSSSTRCRSSDAALPTTFTAKKNCRDLEFNVQMLWLSVEASTVAGRRGCAGACFCSQMVAGSSLFRFAHAQRSRVTCVNRRFICARLAFFFETGAPPVKCATRSHEACRATGRRHSEHVETARAPKIERSSVGDAS